MCRANSSQVHIGFDSETMIVTNYLAKSLNLCFQFKSFRVKIVLFSKWLYRNVFLCFLWLFYVYV